MSFFSTFFHKLELDAQPLVLAAEEWAKAEGLVIVKEIELEMKAKAEPELRALVAGVITRLTGLPLGLANSPVTAGALELATTFLAREKAQAVSGAQLRASVLNAGIEHALLLRKGQAGDTAPQASTAGK